MHRDPYKALEAAGVTMSEHDGLEVSEDASTITVNRAMTIEVKADGMSTLLYMVDGTVADALAKAEVTVGKYDTMNTEMSATVTDGMSIVIDRVAYREYTVNEVIPFETNIKYTNVLSTGKTVVNKNGANGSKTITYRDTIVNGQVVETAKIGEKINKNAVTKEVLKGSAYGTPLSSAPGGIQLNAKNQPVSYKKVFTSKSCTAYSIGSRGASGLKLGVGTCAVDPRVIPYGTKLWITSADGKYVYGYCVAADTGSFVSNGSGVFIDLYFGSYKEACYFGRRSLNIYVIG
jgi:3D (Asp-Asp-Asp) domain-containing protein